MRNFLKSIVFSIFGALVVISLLTWGHKIGFQYIYINTEKLSNFVDECNKSVNDFNFCAEKVNLCFQGWNECIKINEMFVKKLDKCENKE